VGLSFEILAENEIIYLTFAKEWLDGIIIRSDYIIRKLLCLLNLTYYANNLTYYATIMLNSFSAYYAKNYTAYLMQAY